MVLSADDKDEHARRRGQDLANAQVETDTKGDAHSGTWMIVNPMLPVKRPLDGSGDLGAQLAKAVGDLTAGVFDFPPDLFGVLRLRLQEVSVVSLGDELSRISLIHALSL